MSPELSASGQDTGISARTRLPKGTVVKDAAGRIGTICDTGLDEDFVTCIYYIRDQHGEWKTDGQPVTALPGWPVADRTA